MSQRTQIEYAVSAGGVVYRVRDEKVELVLCERNEPRTWSLPKGTPNAGETLEQTALREVEEETGLEVEMGNPLGSITYWFARNSGKIRYKKTVHFYLMQPVGGSLDLHDPEFDQVNWYAADEVLGLMTYLNEAQIVEKALDRVQAELAS